MEEEFEIRGSYKISNEDAFGIYKLAKHKTSDKTYAYRALFDKEKEEKDIEKFRKFNHEFLLKFDKENDLIFWEFCNGGNLEIFTDCLQQKQHCFTEIEIQKIVKQILKGIKFLKQNG